MRAGLAARTGSDEPTPSALVAAHAPNALRFKESPAEAVIPVPGSLGVA